MTIRDEHAGTGAVDQSRPHLTSLLDPNSMLVLDELSVDGEVVISASGEVDMASAPLLWDRLSAAIPEVKARLVVDLSQTTFIDSSALAVFVRAQKRLRPAGADLVLRAPNKAAQTILSITGLDQVLTVERAPSPPSPPAQ